MSTKVETLVKKVETQTPKKSRKPRASIKNKKEEPIVEPIIEESIDESVEEIVEEINEEEKPQTKAQILIQEVDERFDNLLENLKIQMKTSKSIIQDIKSIQGKVHKTNKCLRKEKRNKRDQKSKPSGFNKPIKVSTELCDFLNINEEELIARTTVTKLVHQYIKGQNLKNEEDGRIITPDEKLGALLKLQEGDELTFFNLQKYLNIHFKKAT